MITAKEHTKATDYYFLVILAFIILSYFFWQTYNLKGQFWDYDEGVWAMEAHLVNQGFKLYQEIYTPAPPLFVLSIAAGFKLWGESIETARLVSLVLASIGLLPIGLISRHLGGKFAGIMAIIFLAATPDFYLFSRMPNGTMVSLGIFMWSLLFGLYYYTSGKRLWLYLTTLAATIGLFFKFVPFFLAPILGLTIAMRHFSRSEKTFKQQIKGFVFDSALAAVPFIGATVLCLLIFDAPSFINQVFWHHLGGQDMESRIPRLVNNLLQPISLSLGKILITYGAMNWPTNVLGNVIYFLINHPGLTLLAFLGIYQLFKLNKFYFLFASAWLGVTLLMAFLYKPMFDHLYTIYLYPFSVLASLSVTKLIHSVINLVYRKKQPALFETGLSVLFVAVYLYGVPYFIRFIQFEASSPEQQWIPKAVELVQQTTRQDDWIISDIQSIAFLAQRNVPPPLAETSTMRLESQQLTLKEMQRLTTEYSPKIVITGRALRRIPGYNDWLASQHYSIMFSDEQQKFLVYQLLASTVEPVKK